MFGTNKRCSHCGEQKPLSEFYHSKASEDGYMYSCKVCCNAASKRSYVRKRGRLLRAKRSNIGSFGISKVKPEVFTKKKVVVILAESISPAIMQLIQKHM